MAGTLIARELHKAHGAAAILAGVSLTVAPGDVLGVVGPNGAGKSTLLRLLAGIDAPDRGDVRLTAGTAGYLPQEPDRAPGERLEDYLARRTGVAGAQARVDAAANALAATGGPGERYSDAFEDWLALGGADLEPRAETVLRDLGLDVGLLDAGDRGALGRPGRARVAGRDPAQPLRRPAARRAHQRPRLRRPRAAGALRRRAPGRRGDRLPRPRVPAAHGHARAGARRDRPHRGRVRRRLGGLPGAAGDRRAPPRAALRLLLRPARASDRPRAPPAPVVRDGRQEGQGLRSRQEPRRAARGALGEAGGQGARVREGARAARRGREAVEALGAAAALRRRRALGRRHRAAGARGAAPRQLRPRPAGPRAGVGRAGRAGRPERQREDDARRRPARAAAAVGGHALGRPGRADRDARPGPRRLRRRRHADRRLRRAERHDPAGGALTAGQVRARAGRGRPRGAQPLPRASARGRASRC